VLGDRKKRSDGNEGEERDCPAICRNGRSTSDLVHRARIAGEWSGELQNSSDTSRYSRRGSARRTLSAFSLRACRSDFPLPSSSYSSPPLWTNFVLSRSAHLSELIPTQALCKAPTRFVERWPRARRRGDSASPAVSHTPKAFAISLSVAGNAPLKIEKPSTRRGASGNVTRKTENRDRDKFIISARCSAS
jgi:hypothetical protein